jgi:hypothetical protein
MIESSTEVESFLTRPMLVINYQVRGDTSHVDEVRRFPVRQWGPDLSGAQVSALKEVLLKPENFDLEPCKCEIAPNMGFTFKTAEHSATVLVCHGTRLIVFESGAARVDAAINLRLLEIGVALFPDDTCIGSYYARESLPPLTVGTRMLPEVVGCD